MSRIDLGELRLMIKNTLQCKHLQVAVVLNQPEISLLF